MAGTELECSLFCGAESGCGAWYVDTSSQPDKCVMVVRDSSEQFMNKTLLTQASSNYYIIK